MQKINKTWQIKQLPKLPNPNIQFEHVMKTIRQPKIKIKR